MNDDDEEEDDDDEEVEDEDSEEDGDDDTMSFADRRRRFQKAYEVALATDTQGYRLVTTTDTGNKNDRTPQELTAISWAAFCTEIVPDADATFRIQAMDSKNLFERLKLASHVLRQKKAVLQTRMVKAGLKKDNNLEGEQDETLEG
jgi:hypothetical protein